MFDRCIYSYLGFFNVVLYCSEGKPHSHFITNSRNIIYCKLRSLSSVRSSFIVLINFFLTELL
jgi:hypothetical protein